MLMIFDARQIVLSTFGLEPGGMFRVVIRRLLKADFGRLMPKTQTKYTRCTNIYVSQYLDHILRLYQRYFNSTVNDN